VTTVRNANDQQIAQFPVPYKGTWNSVGANQLSPDSLYSSLNVWIREGKLRERPGIASYSGTVFDSPIVGGAMAVTPTTKINIALSATKLWHIEPGETIWTALASNNTVHAGLTSITFMETASEYVALIADGVSPLRSWTLNGSESNVVASVGTTPTPISVCTAARRIVALVNPHTLVWSEVLDYTNWNALSYNKIAQTNDIGITVLPLSNLAFVLYKERSIYPARTTGQALGAAFSIGEPVKVEGPAGLHAVLDIAGAHMYMTRNGRIGIYDGSRPVQWITDGLWLFLQKDIDQEYSRNIFGVFDYRLNTVIFWYPRNGDSGEMKGMVIINLPLEGSGVESIASFIGISSIPFSFGFETRFEGTIDRTLLFSSEFLDYRSYILNEDFDQDDDQYFDWNFQTGLFPLPDSRHHKVTVEAFLERDKANGQVSIFPVYSNSLENKTGTIAIEDERVLDLAHDPFAEYTGFDKQARFFGLKFLGNSQSNLRYSGSNVYGSIR